jgi:hypothetical protein
MFTKLTNAFKSSTNIKGVLVTESAFNTLYRGVALNNPGSVDPGAQGFRILGNSFDLIHQQGIVTQTNQQLVVSGYNVFYDVGNGLSSPVIPTTSVVDFADNNNVSIGDLFQRSDAQAEIRPRVRLGSTDIIAVTNGKKIQLGSYTRESGPSMELDADVTDEPLFTVESDVIPAFKMEYTITRDAGDSASVEVRSGTLTVVRSTSGDGSDLISNDDFYQNRDTGFSLGVSETTGIITVSYSDNSGDPLAAPGNIKYSISYLA